MSSVILLFAILMIASCGGNSGSSNSSTYSSNNTGTIKAIVTGSKSFNPNISHGKIVKYKITITGEGIEAPVVAEIDGTADSGTVEGVPSGDERTVRVEAINPNELSIRDGEVSGVHVSSGETEDVEITLESVPVFANIKSGASIPNTRFIVRVFSDPKDPVMVEDEFGGSIAAMTDVSTSGIEISPNVVTGIASISPALLSVGEHSLTAKNYRTNRSSNVIVRIIDGTKQKGAPFFSVKENL